MLYREDYVDPCWVMLAGPSAILRSSPKRTASSSSSTGSDLRSKDFAKFDLIVKEFSRQAAPHLGNEKIEAAGFGIAGPVIGNRIRATNLPWVIDADSLAEELKRQAHRAA